jgi:hypothetical protein
LKDKKNKVNHFLKRENLIFFLAASFFFEAFVPLIAVGNKAKVFFVLINIMLRD